jgi:hypothetical protein
MGGLRLVCARPRRDPALQRRAPRAGYRYVVLQAWEYGQIAAIKRQSPGTKVLVYKDMASTRDDATQRQPALSTGVSYRYADRYHPEWFLKDTSGKRVNWASWPHSWQMDIGSRSYQRAWARNVARELRRRGWDGVLPSTPRWRQDVGAPLGLATQNGIVWQRHRHAGDGLRAGQLPALCARRPDGVQLLAALRSRAQFANGIVVVNPTGSATVTVPLGRIYVQPNGTAVTSLLLGPHSGAVLRKP